MSSVPFDIEPLKQLALELGNRIQDALRQTNAAQSFPARREVVPLLTEAQSTFSTAFHLLDIIESLTGNYRDSSQPNLNEFCRFFSDPLSGTHFYTVVARTQLPMFTINGDRTFATIAPEFKANGFFATPLGIQPLLLPLLTMDCFMYVDDDADPHRGFMGFSTAILFSFATRLLQDYRNGIVAKALIVTRTSKLASLTRFAEAMPPVVQMVYPGSSAIPATTLPRIIVVNMDDFRVSDVSSDTLSYIFVDSFRGTDVLNGLYLPNLKVSVFRGPSCEALKARVHKCPLRLRIWSTPRTVGVFATRSTDIFPEVSDMICDLASRAVVAVVCSQSQQPRLRASNATLVSTVDQVPADIEQLILCETPSTREEISTLLSRCPAKNVVFVVTPLTQKNALSNALVEWGFTVPNEILQYQHGYQTSAKW